tara:strand:+ start:75 stop:545 length:471 start_codon:yes stop_codon:yes gene_type:complete
MANSNHDETIGEYKIFKLSNGEDDFYISYTKQKYLTRAMTNYKRKNTDTFKRLFNGSCVKIELLEIVITENIYFVKNKINEYISKEESKFNVKVAVEVEAEVCEEAEAESTDDNESTTESTTKADIECKDCNCMVTYTNWARHIKTKKHLKNSNCE